MSTPAPAVSGVSREQTPPHAPPDAALALGPRVIGLDPSLTGTGVAGYGWSVAVGSKGNVTKDPYPDRYARIVDLAERVNTQIGRADLVVMEAPAFDAKSTSAHDRAGLWWEIYGRLTRRRVPIATVTTGGLKKYATGSGNAAKTRVVEQVARRFGHIWVDLGGDDNRADAAVLAAMGLDHYAAPVVSLPAAHRVALTAVAWPDLPSDQ